MPRTGNTTERGYGHQHQQTRRRLLAALVDGELCDRCDKPMYRDDAANLDAAHPHDRPVGQYADSVATHLEHKGCNRGAPALDAAAKPRCKWHDACGSTHSRAW